MVSRIDKPKNNKKILIISFFTLFLLLIGFTLGQIIAKTRIRLNPRAYEDKLIDAVDENIPSSSSYFSPTPTETSIPILTYDDLISDYFGNRTYSRIIESKPWINNSFHRTLYEKNETSVWDFFYPRDRDDWESADYGWQDDEGVWRSFTKGNIHGETSYIIVDRDGPGVVDKMIFTQHSYKDRQDEDFEDLNDWGYLSKIGKLLIEVDNEKVYEGPIRQWFEGYAFGNNPEKDLLTLFFWKYKDMGSNGSTLPIPYQKHIKISVYGGEEKPKWFIITGATFPQETKIESFKGRLSDSIINKINTNKENITHPENYINQYQTDEVVFYVGDQSQKIQKEDRGTIEALQFRIPKNYDVLQLKFKISYGYETGIDLPLLAFFGDQDKDPKTGAVVTHHSTPMGIIDDPKDPQNYYLFYSNYPMPYQNGITIEVTTKSLPVTIPAKIAFSDRTSNTRFLVRYDGYLDHPKLVIGSEDYKINVSGNGKLVGFILATRDQQSRNIPSPSPYPNQGAGRTVWPMAYLESNVNMSDSRKGTARILSGIEEIGETGYWANDAYTNPAGGGNRYFSGILGASFEREKGREYDMREDSYVTFFRYYNDLSAFRFIDGLKISIQHGTWKNNFPVRYGATLFYYLEII